jgi:hypothetical protein
MSPNPLTSLHLEIVIVFGQMELFPTSREQNFPSLLGYKENFAMEVSLNQPG